jgi:hypothetical protein
MGTYLQFFSNIVFFNSHIFEKKSSESRVDLAQLVRFIVVKLIHSGSNLRFDMCVIFMSNYSFNRR